MSMFTPAQEAKIYEEFSYGENKSDLARKYNCSTRTIGRVIERVENQISEREKSNQVVVHIDVGSQHHFDEFAFEDPDMDDEDYDEDFMFFEDEIQADEPSYEYDFVVTASSIAITRINTDTDDIESATLSKGHENFDRVFDMIYQDRSDVSLAKAFEICNYKARIEFVSEGRVTAYPERNVIEYIDNNGAVGQFSGQLVNRVLEAAESGQQERLTGLMKFADKLALNPSFRAVNELYEFLEAADINITEDGMVECFKKVTEEYQDCYTRTIDNSVGTTPSIPRNMVDEDSDVTCSRGLHVCSKAYLRSYGGQRIMRVLVDPADFVAIPRDYYSLDGDGQVKAKARVCKYQVVEDLTEDLIDYI